jgi:hypothetical protein
LKFWFENLKIAVGVFAKSFSELFCTFFAKLAKKNRLIKQAFYVLFPFFHQIVRTRAKIFLLTSCQECK